jgi:hypothetical protein
MNPVRVVAGVREALRNLNPNEVRESAHLPFHLELHASSDRMYEQMRNFFAPADKLSDARRADISDVVHRGTDSRPSSGVMILIYEKGLPHDAGPGFIYDTMNPQGVVDEILDAHNDLKLSLARRLWSFREAVARRVIWTVSKENALFSIATAVPSVMPLISAPWAIGEFASDTAVLTANQIRMAFMLAAASDRTVGYREQRAEIASLFAGAFGWRAIARELVGKIPFGGGLIPKAAVSFAGTYVIGASLDRLYRVGYGFTPEERKQAYQNALDRGKEIAASLLSQYTGSSKKP